MQQPLPSPPQTDPENKCPDCLYMKLEGSPVQPQKQGIFNRKSQPAAIEQIDLLLTINFNEQRQELIGGSVTFGLRGGELKLNLTNGKFPYELRELASALELSVQIERQDQEGSKVQRGVEASWADKPGVKAKVSTEQTAGTTDKVQFTACQVTITGSEDKPAWEFEEKRGEPVLKGLLKKTKLVTLNVTAMPCRIEATFEVSLKNVRVIEAEGLWLKDLSPEKRKVLDIGLAKLLLKHKIKPYLSRQELEYV